MICFVYNHSGNINKDIYIYKYNPYTNILMCEYILHVHIKKQKRELKEQIKKIHTFNSFLVNVRLKTLDDSEFR